MLKVTPNGGRQNEGWHLAGALLMETSENRMPNNIAKTKWASRYMIWHSPNIAQLDICFNMLHHVGALSICSDMPRMRRLPGTSSVWDFLPIPPPPIYVKGLHMSTYGKDPRIHCWESFCKEQCSTCLVVGVYLLVLPTCSGKLGPCAANWSPSQGFLSQRQLKA